MPVGGLRASDPHLSMTAFSRSGWSGSTERPSGTWPTPGSCPGRGGSPRARHGAPARSVRFRESVMALPVGIWIWSVFRLRR